MMQNVCRIPAALLLWLGNVFRVPFRGFMTIFPSRFITFGKSNAFASLSSWHGTHEAAEFSACPLQHATLYVHGTSAFTRASSLFVLPLLPST